MRHHINRMTGGDHVTVSVGTENASAKSNTIKPRVKTPQITLSSVLRLDRKVFSSKIRNKIKMLALPAIHSTRPGILERVIRQEKEAKGVHTGKEEAESPELTGHGHRLPGPVPPWLREPSAKKGESSSWL